MLHPPLDAVQLRAERWEIVGHGNGKIRRIRECKIGHVTCSVYELAGGAAEIDMDGLSAVVEGSGSSALALAVRLAEIAAICAHRDGNRWIDDVIGNALRPIGGYETDGGT